MTLQEFSQLFAVLAVQLRQTDADEATIRGYFKALSDLDVELVALASERLARTAEWFPKTSEWREMTLKIERERLEQQRAVLRERSKLGQPLCTACEDTGWEPGPDGVRKCACLATRRLEVLGRRPMPLLLSERAGDMTIPVDADQIASTLASTKGMR